MRVSAYCSHVVCGRERAFKEVLGGEDGQEGLSRGDHQARIVTTMELARPKQRKKAFQAEATACVKAWR